MAKKVTKPAKPANKVVKPTVKKSAPAKKTIKPVAKSSSKPVSKPVAKSAPKKVTKLAPKKAVKVAPKKAAKPAPKKVVKVAPKKVTKPAPKKAIKVIPKKVVKPASKKVVKVAPKKVAKPLAKKVVKPLAKPIATKNIKNIKPLAKKDVKPVSKKIVKEVPKKATKLTPKPVAKAEVKKTASKIVAPKAAIKPAAKPVVAPVVPPVHVKPVAKNLAVKKITVEKGEKVNANTNTPFNDKPIEKEKPVFTSIVPKKTVIEDIGKSRYSDIELDEFRKLINDKLSSAKKELDNLKEALNSISGNSAADTESSYATFEDGSATQEKEHLSQMAARQRKFIGNLDAALGRIENKTYGICAVTGKLIPKERLRAVPHTTVSIEAKLGKV